MFKQKFFLIVLTIYQLFSTALIAIGVWPAQVVYINLAVQLGAILFFDLEYALYSVILSIPFYLAVPNPKFDSLSAWRFTFLALLIVLWYKQVFKAKQKLRWMSWDPHLIFLTAIIILSIIFEPFKTVGAKKLLFVANAYFLYVAALNIIRSKQKVLRVIKTGFVSTAMIVLLGYVQLASTFATSIYYFWQYWATFISKAYYGKTLADSLTYSNSWFSFYKNSPPSLRMFSILPDSHAFAVIAMFSIPFAAGLLYSTKKTWQKILLWAYIVFADLAIIFSGTRGVWVGILAPLVILTYLYIKHWGRKLIAPMFLPILIFFALFAISPLIQKAVATIRNGATAGNFIQRAQSVYDLGDTSNAGRIAIWKSTLKYALVHPLLGAGFGDFIVTLPISNAVPKDYQQLANQKNQTYNLPNQYITAHNLYLDFLAETGLLGLTAFLLYLGGIAKKFWIFFKNHYLYSDDGLIFFAVNAAIYLAWLFAYSLFDGTLINDRVLMYFFLMLAISGSIISAYSV